MLAKLPRFANCRSRWDTARGVYYKDTSATFFSAVRPAHLTNDMSLDSDLLTTGIQLHQAGNVEAAYAIYQQAVHSDPQNAAALSLLGAACINLKKWDEAARHLRDAIQIEPNHVSAYDNLGVLYAKQGRFAEAVECFRRAASISPNNPQTHLNLAAALQRAGDTSGALDSYRTASHLDPNSLRAHREAARLLLEGARATEAVPHLRQLARLKAQDPEAHFNLAAALAQAGQAAEAIAAYHEVLRRKPDSAEAHVNLAQLHIEKRDYDAAIDATRQAIALRPRFAEAHLNLASALLALKRHAEAREALAECLRLKPDLSQAHNNLGNLLADEGRLAEAEAAYLRAQQLNPASAQSPYNLGIVVLRQGRVEASLPYFQRSLALAPRYAEAHHNHASALLLLGRYAEGLAEYEWRFQARDFPQFRPRWPIWDGADPAGKTIVLIGEQGLGDTLQFIRYAQPLAERGARVIVECPPALHPLLARTPGVSGWIAPTDPAPGADACVPLLSMPHRLRTTLETIPAMVPYIFADEARVAAWRDEIRSHDKLRVGIAWQGNPHAPYDRERSIPLAHFAPLAALADVQLFCLQKGEGNEQLSRFAREWNVVDFGERLDAAGGAFMDTAAIMQHLDLVITSDTSMAHLAGALGVPTWVALNLAPDWRWLLEREDSPWYPAMRLYRQRTLGDWGEVFERIAAELARGAG